MRGFRLGLLSVLIIALLFPSCEKKGFSVSSVTLKKVGSVLEFRFSSTDEDSSYELMLTSPSGALVWNSPLTKAEDGMFYSEPLEITEGASFEKGAYTYMIYSSSGTEVESDILF